MKATWQEDGQMRYDWSAIHEAAQVAGLDPDEVKDWVFDGVTDECTADEIIAGFVSEREAKDIIGGIR